MMYRQLPAKFKKRLTITPDEWDQLVATAALLGIQVRAQEKWISFVAPGHEWAAEVRAVGSSLHYIEQALKEMAKKRGLVHYGGHMSSEVADGAHK